jgi:hypothetical protein
MGPVTISPDAAAMGICGEGRLRPPSHGHMLLGSQLGRSQMHDIVIRGGTIIDGTGAAVFAGDVAVNGDRISQIGGKAGRAKREIDANGLLVTLAGSTSTLIMTARQPGIRCLLRRRGTA